MRLTSTAPRRVAATALCCGALLGWLACGGGGCDGTEPCPPPGNTGELQVVVTTAGPDTDPNGYTLLIGGVADSTVQPNDTLSITGLAPGALQVQLTDLTANCAVSGTNPKSVTILQKIGLSAPPSVATFQVTCGVGTGSVLVKATTTGDPPDPDGYQLLLDGIDQGNIQVQDGITLSGVTTTQDHNIALGGVNANCQLQGDNPRTFQVTPGTQVEVEFIITCHATTQEIGALQVTVITTGQDPDPDGYGLSLDGEPPNLLASTPRSQYRASAWGITSCDSLERPITVRCREARQLQSRSLLAPRLRSVGKWHAPPDPAPSR